MVVPTGRASIGCMVTPSKLLGEFCSGHSRRCEDVRCWLPAQSGHSRSFDVGFFIAVHSREAVVPLGINVNRPHDDDNRASEVHSLFRMEEH